VGAPLGGGRAACWLAARGVQTMMVSKPASSPCAPAQRLMRSLDAAEIERPAQPIGELSGKAGLDAREALWSLFFPRFAIFFFAAGKTVGPVAHDEKPSRQVVDAAVIDRPAYARLQLN
jgi:hypothetical protein